MEAEPLVAFFTVFCILALVLVYRMSPTPTTTAHSGMLFADTHNDSSGRVVADARQNVCLRRKAVEWVPFTTSSVISAETPPTPPAFAHLASPFAKGLWQAGVRPADRAHPSDGNQSLQSGMPFW